MKFLLLLITFSSYGFVSYIPKEEACKGIIPTKNSIKPFEGSVAIDSKVYKGNVHHYCNLVPIMKDDLENPKWSTRSMIESCEDQEACEEIFVTKSCNQPRAPQISIESLEVYCAYIEGYDQIESGSYSVVIDETKKQEFEAKLAAQNKIQDIIAKGKLDRQKTLEALDYVIGLNAALPQAQRDAMDAEFSEISTALREFKRQKALDLITAKQVDSSLQALKDKLIEILTL